MTSDRCLDRLAAELARQWVDMGSFFLSRKLRSRSPGVAADLSPVQQQAMSALSVRPFHVGELATHVGLAESSTTRLVDRLESLGLVARRVERTDRRAVAVELTPTGRRVATALEQGRRAFLTEMLEALAPEEREEYVRLFAKAAAALAQKEEPIQAAGPRRAS